MSAPLVDPPSAMFTANAVGSSLHNVGNPTEARIAIKVKITDNAVYKVAPVFAFIEAGTAIPIEITRTASVGKDDKMVILYAPAPQSMVSPQEAFAAGGTFPELPIALMAQ